MTALIRQANSGYELANKPKILKKYIYKKKKDAWGKRREKTTTTTTTTTNKHFLKRKRRQEMSASKVTKAGYTSSVYTTQPT